MLCSRKPSLKVAVRLNKDMGDVPICDNCVINSRDADMQLNRTFTPKFEVPDEVIKGVLYIGSKASQVNLEFLRQNGITRVLICCNLLRAYHDRNSGILYHRLPIEDSL